MLERDCCTVISLLILRNFWENFIAEHLLVTAFHIIFFFSFLQISEVCSLKSVSLVEQWHIRRSNPQAHSVVCSYENQVETSVSGCGHTSTNLGIIMAREVEEKKELKNLLMWGEFSFHVMVDTYVKNEK